MTDPEIAAAAGSETSRRVCLRYVLRHPVAFREYWVPKVSRRPFWQRYTFVPPCLALDQGDVLLRAGRGGGKCVDGTTTVMDPATGRLMTIAAAVEHGQKEIVALAGSSLESAGITERFVSGEQGCVRVRLRSGRSIVLTPSHPLLTAEGWVSVGRLKPGETIAVPRRLPWPTQTSALPWADVDLLAVLIAEGCITQSTVLYTTTDPEIVRIASEAADVLGAESRLLSSGRGMAHLIGRVSEGFKGLNPVRLMLNSYGLVHEKSIEKYIPAALFEAPAEQVSRFLSIFWMCDGYVTAHEAGLALASEVLVRQIQHLLLRFGVQSKVTYKRARIKNKFYDSWRLGVYAACLPALASTLSLWGEKGRRLDVLLARRRNPNVGDYVSVSPHFLASLRARGRAGVGRMTKARAGFSLPLFRRWAHANGYSQEFPSLMTTDLWWDRVERIEDVGVRPTFDLEVFPSACFVANDILVHNSYALLEPEIVRHALQRPGEETLLTSLRRVHVVDRMERAIDYFETVPLFRMYLKRILRSPYYMIELKHDHSIYGVSVGDDPEARMAQGKHASRIIVEEAHQYPERAYAKLQGATDPRGSLRLMVGVPDGRVDTPFRKAASRYESFAGRRFRISRRLDPFFSQRDKRDFADTFGGVDHDLFKQEVDALDGSPVWSAWDLDALYRCVEGSLSPLASGKYHLEVSGRVYQDQQLTPQVVCADLPGPDRREARRFIAVDVGYTEPSEVGVWEHRRDRWWLIARVKLTNRMEHHHQADVISAVGQLYEVERIAVDATDGEGRAIAAQLEQEAHWRRGEGADFDRVVRVMFTESELVGWDADGEELWEPGREFATRALRALIASKTLALPPDEDIPAEFNQEKETRAQDGRVRVMTPRSVHVTDMCRVFSVLHHRAFPPAPPVEEETGVFCEPEWGDIDPAALRM